MVVKNGSEWQPSESLSVIVTSSDSSITILDSVWEVGSLNPGDSLSNDGSPFVFVVSDELVPHITTFNVKFVATRRNIPESKSIDVLVGQPYVLIVDDDGGDDYESFYEDVLDSIGLVFDYWNVESEGVPQEDGIYGMNSHLLTIWFTGQDTLPLDESERNLITSYVNSGKNIFISSQYIGESLSGDSFVSNVLKAQIVSTNTDEIFVDGIEGDPISDSMSMVIFGPPGANNSVSEDGVDAVNGAEVFLKYRDSQLGAGIRYNGDYKLIYLPFPFEAINNSSGETSNYQFMGSVLKWFGIPTGVQEEISYGINRGDLSFKVTPTLLRDRFSISFVLQRKEEVSVNLYDVTGRRVATLYNSILGKGKHSMDFSIGRLPSGVYFVSLKGSLNPVKIIKIR